MLALELVQHDERETRWNEAVLVFLSTRLGTLGQRLAGWYRKTLLHHDLSVENPAHRELLETTRRLTLRRTKVIARAQKRPDAASTTSGQVQRNDQMNLTTTSVRRDQ